MRRAQGWQPGLWPHAPCLRSALQTPRQPSSNLKHSRPRARTRCCSKLCALLCPSLADAAAAAAGIALELDEVGLAASIPHCCWPQIVDGLHEEGPLPTGHVSVGGERRAVGLLLVCSPLVARQKPDKGVAEVPFEYLQSQSPNEPLDSTPLERLYSSESLHWRLQPVCA